MVFSQTGLLCKRGLLVCAGLAIYCAVFVGVTEAASSKNRMLLSGVVRIKSTSCGNQSQLNEVCAVTSRPAPKIGLRFQNAQAQEHFNVQTDEAGQFTISLPAGIYSIESESDPLIFSLSPSEIEIKEGIKRQIELTILEKIQ